MKSNLTQGKPASKPKNRPAAYAKNREAQSLRAAPTAKAPALPDEARIRNGLLNGPRHTGHNRKGR